MKKYLTIFAFILAALSGCKRAQVSEEDNQVYLSAKARIVEYSCNGDISQLIDVQENKGQDWLGRAELMGSDDSNVNPRNRIYKNCVHLYPLPNNVKIGDTLEFTYRKVRTFSGMICTIGIAIDSLYEVKKLKTVN